MFTTIAQKRRAFALKHAPAQSAILEIGPFNNPTFRREAGDDVHYMDLFSRSELARMHARNPNRKESTIVETDFVVKSLNFSNSISRKFDLLVANHVVEHVADLLLWFAECEALLRDGGRLLLSVPDRNYTFDFFRPVSLASQILRAHEERARKPQLWQVVDHFYYHQKVNAAELWAGKDPGPFAPRFPLAEALRMAKARETIYTDTHCWVFTPESFAQVVTDLKTSRYLQFDIEALQETERASNEFRVLLKKR